MQIKQRKVVVFFEKYIPLYAFLVKKNSTFVPKKILHHE